MSEEVKEIKQPDTWSCMACVAAMIAGETLQDVVDFVGHDGSAKDIKTPDHPDGYRGFSDYDITQYLLDRGYLLGAVLLVKNQKDVQKQLESDKDVQITMGWKPSSLKCYLGVKSEQLDGIDHAIYWDGTRVWDPSPNVDSSKRSLSDYKIQEVVPIQKCEWVEIQHWNHRHGKPSCFDRVNTDKSEG